MNKAINYSSLTFI
jgi:hypothetical protein